MTPARRHLLLSSTRVAVPPAPPPKPDRWVASVTDFPGDVVVTATGETSIWRRVWPKRDAEEILARASASLERLRGR